MWVLLWLGNESIAHYLDEKISWMTAPLRRAGVGLIAMAVYTVATVYLLAKFFEWLWNFDMGNGMESMLYTSVGIAFVITLFMTSRSFLFNWRSMAVNAEKLNKESVIAQYEALKSQVNPHFLFNSLNVLTNLVYSDQDKAASFIKKLAEVYRYVLDTRQMELVSLEEELAFAESYIFLLRIRFGDNLKIENQIDSKVGKVVPLSIQMLLENAVKHNEVSAEQPLEVKLFIQDGFIIVSNTLKLKSNMLEGNSGVGLQNIKRRYEFLTPQKVTIENTQGSFIVRIPVLQ